MARARRRKSPTGYAIEVTVDMSPPWVAFNTEWNRYAAASAEAPTAAMKPSSDVLRSEPLLPWRIGAMNPK